VVTQTKRRVIKPGAAGTSKPAAETARSATNAEQEARLNASSRPSSARLKKPSAPAEEAKRRAEEEARLKKEAEEEAARLAEEAKLAAEAEARKPKVKEKPVVEDEPVAVAAAKRGALDEDAPSGGRGGDSRKRAESPTPAKPTPRTDERRRSKLTITRALNDDGNQRGRSMAAMRRRQEKARRGQQPTGPREKVLREVTIPDAITIQELANRMAERSPWT
jgi:translation initiation factor IF-2